MRTGNALPTTRAHTCPKSLCEVGHCRASRIKACRGELGLCQREGLAQYLTDVILFSVEISPRGDIEGLDRVREGLAAAKRQKQLQPKLRVLLCVGGAGRSRGFPFVSKRSDDRKTFVKKLVMLCEEQGLDGIDFDWEGGRDS